MFHIQSGKETAGNAPKRRLSLGKDQVWPPWTLALLLALAVILVYLNSLHSPFIYDDYLDVLENTSIRHLWPLRDVFRRSGGGFISRPIVNLSFALDYALGGLRPFYFHLTNLAIHLCASLALLGVLRRSLSLPIFRERYKAHLPSLALVTAALWALHPLATESVSYITQRYESLMALFVLWTFYAVLRSLESTHPLRWQFAGALSCLLALGSKEVAVSLPLLVLLFDRIFIAPSFRGIWRERKLLYVGMVLAWIPFVFIQLHTGGRNFAASSVTIPWWRYAFNQPRVILHYLRLVVWPHPLVFDYFWRENQPWTFLFPGFMAVGALIVFTLWALFRHLRLAYLPIVFLVILAPTSSVMPILDLAVEHRMYLPLIPVLLALVLFVYFLLMHVQAGYQRVFSLARPALAAGLAAILACLGILTFLRNEDYKDPLDLWRSVIVAVPNNPRGHNNYAFALAERGYLKEALAEYGVGVALAPQAPLFHSNYGLTLAKSFRYEEALEHLRAAVKLEPGQSRHIVNLGMVLVMKGSLDNAVTCFEAAIQINPKDEMAYAGLGAAMEVKRDLPKALAYTLQAIALDPYSPRFREQQAQILFDQGDIQGARAAYQIAIKLEPSAERISGLAWAMYKHDLSLDAVRALQQSLRMRPGHAKSQIRLAWIYATSADPALRNGPEAVRLAQQVLQSQQPIRSPEILDLLAVSLAETGRFQEARATVQEALGQSKNRQESWVGSLEEHLALFEKNLPFHEPAKAVQR